MDGEEAFELCSELIDLLQRARRFDDVEALIGRVESTCPEAAESEAGYFALWRAENEVLGGRGRELAAVVALGKHLAKVGDLADKLVDRLRFHGRADLLEAMLEVAWPLIRDDDDLMGWVKDEVMNTLIDLILARHLARKRDLRADDPALLADLARSVPELEKPASAILPFLPAPDRSWSRAEVLRAVDQGKDEDEDEDEEQEQNVLHGLVIEFAYVLQSRGWTPLRSYMARSAMYNLVMSGLESNRRRALANTTSLLVPEVDSLRAHVLGQQAFLGIKGYIQVAIVLALPRWVEFLVERELVDADKTKATLRNFFREPSEVHQRLAGWLKEEMDPAALAEVGATFRAGGAPAKG